ncbi:MAG: D-alanine--D-alanine ligase [Planctomycetota bacterium]|jgi:D-alanine-D-alanine ligase
MTVVASSIIKETQEVSKKTCVAVLMGGNSSERDVSFESGRAVLESLRGAGLDVFAFDPSESSLGEMLKRHPSVVFLALHGKGGEDGTIQRRLEALDIRYTGSGPQASALAMDKVLTKKAFTRRGIPTPPYRVIAREEIDQAEVLCKGLGYPVVVKPASEGSSVGVSTVHSRFGLFEGLEKAFQYGKRAIVEKRIEGREFCVGIVGRTPLPLVEVAYSGDIFSYHAKYEDPTTAIIYDHGLPLNVQEGMQQIALAAFDALGARHYARVDIMLSFGDWTPYVLEVNTLPGMTNHSLLPKAAKRMGVSFTDLCLQILDLAGEEGVW